MAGIKGRSGRQPREKYLSKAISDALLANDCARLRRILNTMIEKAEEGDVAAWRELNDRWEGKPHASVDVDMNMSSMSNTELNARIAELQGKRDV